MVGGVLVFLVAVFLGLVDWALCFVLEFHVIRIRPMVRDPNLMPDSAVIARQSEWKHIFIETNDLITLSSTA